MHTSLGFTFLQVQILFFILTQCCAYALLGLGAETHWVRSGGIFLKKTKKNKNKKNTINNCRNSINIVHIEYLCKYLVQVVT